jgi:two-component system sensor histidine kinase KdpD
VGAGEGLLNDDVGGNAAVRHELAHEIQSAAERLDNVVQNLLAMTRLESGLIRPNLDWTDLRDVINSAISKLRNELSGHKVTVEISPAMPLIRLDYPLMEQVVINLLRNAAMHTPAGSRIDVKAVHDQADRAITIADNGPGFPAEALPRLFEKFYRVPGSRTGGVGLGLSIVRGFVQAHSGSVVAENRPGGGAQFTIRLPLEQGNHTHAELAHE